MILDVDKYLERVFKERKMEKERERVVGPSLAKGFAVIAWLNFLFLVDLVALGKLELTLTRGVMVAIALLVAVGASAVSMK